MTATPRPADDAVHILHLSDPHMTGSGFDSAGVDTRHALDCLLEAIDDVPRIDIIVTTGDLSDDGSVAGCRRVRESVGALAAERGAPHIYTTGNHDTRVSFSAVFGTGHLSPRGVDYGTSEAPEALCGAVSEVNGLRVITLDSLVPGSVHGEISQQQLDWLRDVLSSPASNGSVVALHHPPLTLPGHPLRDYLLHDVMELGDVLTGSDVRAVLCGHVHHQMVGSLRSIPVLVAPGIVTRVDLAAPVNEMRAVLGAGAAMVELRNAEPPISYAISSRDPRAGKVVYRLDTRTGNRDA